MHCRGKDLVLSCCSYPLQWSRASCSMAIGQCPTKPCSSKFYKQRKLNKKLTREDLVYMLLLDAMIGFAHFVWKKREAEAICWSPKQLNWNHGFRKCMSDFLGSGKSRQAREETGISIFCGLWRITCAIRPQHQKLCFIFIFLSDFMFDFIGH